MRNIDDQKLDAFHHALSQSVVGIVRKDASGEFGSSIGTGTFITLNGGRYILTAAHVIKDCTANELRYFLPFEGVKIAESPTPAEMMRQVEVRQTMKIESIRMDSSLDVALLKLAPSVRIEPFWTFRELRRMPHPPVPTLQFVMMGFPIERAVPFSGDILMAIRNVDYPEIVSNENLNEFDPNVNFQTDFPSADTFHPGGYSGSGLWNDEPDQGSVWQPRPVYNGMELAYSRSRKILVILSVNAILDFVSGTEIPQ